MKRNYSFTIGVIVIVIGALILFQNIGLNLGINLNIGTLFNLLWPLLLFYYGFNRIMKHNAGIMAYVAIALGMSFTLSALSDIHPLFRMISTLFWPLLIIAIGLLFIVKPNNFRRKNYQFRAASKETFRDFEDDDSGYTYQSDNDSFIDVDDLDQTIIYDSPSDYKSTDSNTQQADAYDDLGKSSNKRHKVYSTSFNSRRIDVNAHDLLEGKNTIDLHCNMGELRISLPRSVDIIMDGQISLGEIRFLSKRYDGIASNPRARYTASEKATKQIHLRATVKLGEIRVKLHE